MAGYRPNDNKRRNMFLNCDLDNSRSSKLVCSDFTVSELCLSFVSLYTINYQHYKTFLIFNFILVLNLDFLR